MIRLLAKLGEARSDAEGSASVRARRRGLLTPVQRSRIQRGVLAAGGRAVLRAVPGGIGDGSGSMATSA
jgi:hypothetical protein